MDIGADWEEDRPSAVHRGRLRERFTGVVRERGRAVRRVQRDKCAAERDGEDLRTLGSHRERRLDRRACVATNCRTSDN